MVLRVAFDIDGPLVFDNWRLHRFFLFMQDSGIQCDYSVFTLTGHWAEAVPGLNREKISAAWLQYKIQKNVQDVPTPGAIAALNVLAGAERIIATARTASERAATLQFLNHHYGVFKECHFELDCKLAAVREAHCFIDDNVGIANKAAEQASNGNIVVLFPTPGLSGRATHPRVITLEAEKYMSPEVNEGEWHRVCEMAWQEISTILQPVLAPT